MDVYISEEYVTSRRRERMRLRAEGGGHRAEKTTDPARKGEEKQRVWQPLGFQRKEKVAAFAGAGADAHGCDEIVFNCFSA